MKVEGEECSSSIVDPKRVEICGLVPELAAEVFKESMESNPTGRYVYLVRTICVIVNRVQQ